MRPITSLELRRKYLDYFSQRGHSVLPSASLLPENDPSVLFTTAGMHPLVPYLLGQTHPEGGRLTSAQSCVRTGDIEIIGDDTHLTFFEMLGNWSLGDYFREESIHFSFEFLTSKEWLGLPLERLGVTCFAGDDNVPRDTDSARIWQSLGVPSDRVAFLGREHNFWGPVGASGPCGPDTEIFYFSDPTTTPPRAYDPDDPRWVEIWNNVFMSHTQTPSGQIEPLQRFNVDTGMGLERTLAALCGVRTVYEIDTLAPILRVVRELVRNSSPDIERRLRVVTDHMRASCFLIADGVLPSNKKQGYVLRRLLRRSSVMARQLGFELDWHETVIDCVRQTLGSIHPQLEGQRTLIEGTIQLELNKFERTLSRGLRQFERLPIIDGRAAFDLYQTYGFPWELTRELAQERGQEFDLESFRKQFEDHQATSRRE